MSASTRWSVRLGAGLAIAVISISGTLVWCTAHPGAKPKVPLTAGLNGEWTVISAEFDRRLKTRFPVGSSEKQMAADLQQQGFSRQDWESSVELEHEAVRREDTFICLQAARIYWRADSEGRLLSIRGVYREKGCL